VRLCPQARLAANRRLRRLLGRQARSPAPFFLKKGGVERMCLTHYARDRYTCLTHDADLFDRCAGRYFQPDESTQSPLGRCECAPDPCRPLFRGENLRFSPLPRQAIPLFPLWGTGDESFCACAHRTGAARDRRGVAGYTRLPEP